MKVWPLIHRELLVGARRRSTQWIRVAVALIATIIGAIYIPIVSTGITMSPGNGLFLVLIWLGFGVSGLFGVFFAADVISSERREGTLGLLFLTRLRSFDVVLGKLFSTALRAAFSLLAAAPVMALPLLLGGVTFESYWQAALVLANTLFVSVAMGLMVSSFNRNPVRAVLGTLFCVMGLAGATFVIDGLLMDFFDERQFVPRTCYASPAFALVEVTNG